MSIRSFILASFVCSLSLHSPNALQAKNVPLPQDYLELSENEVQPSLNSSWPKIVSEVKLPKDTKLSPWLPSGSLKIVPAKKGALRGALIFNNEAYNNFTKSNAASNIQILSGRSIRTAEDQNSGDTYLTLISRSGIFSPSIHAVWVDLNKLTSTSYFSKTTIILFD